VAYSAYFLWWVLGSGDLMWPLFASIMLVFMIGRHGLRFPPGSILWVFFLAWVLASGATAVLTRLIPYWEQAATSRSTK